MTLLVTGLSHKNTPIEVLEKALIPQADIPTALADIQDSPHVQAVVVLSTCNRCEIYADVNDVQASDALHHWLIEHTACKQEEFERYCFTLTEQHAAQHLARVACSLEAMMIGETQILGQVKQAYQQAQQAKSLNANLARLFENTLSIGKQVRYETNIAKHPVSFIGAATKILRQVFSNFDDKDVLMVGSGEMIQIATKHLSEQGLKHITICGRSEKNVFDLAVQYRANSLAFDRLEGELHQFDIVVSSTASLKPIITYSSVIQALKKRKHRPMFMVDLALPRDIESSVRKIEDVYLYTLENLAAICDENQNLRLQSADEAKFIIDHRIQEHFEWMQANDANDAITMFRQQADNIQQEAVAKALKQLENGEAPEKIITMLGKSLANKLSHTPTEILKKIAIEHNAETLQIVHKILKR